MGQVSCEYQAKRTLEREPYFFSPQYHMVKSLKIGANETKDYVIATSNEGGREEKRDGEDRKYGTVAAENNHCNCRLSTWRRGGGGHEAQSKDEIKRGRGNSTP